VPDRPTPGAGKGTSTTTQQERPWDPAALHILFVPGQVKAGNVAYKESLGVHTRLPADKRLFQSCTSTPWFAGAVFFQVDYTDWPLPPHLIPPHVIVQRKWKVSGKEYPPRRDESPKYIGPGWFLRTSFEPPFQIPVHDKDTLELEFTLQDLDTHTTLTYKDKIQVKLITCP
jgi:hypothetical protein